jgi:hypothetical protein
LGTTVFFNKIICVKEEEIEDTIGVIRIRKSKNGQHIHQKTRSKDRVKRTDNTYIKREGQKYRQHIHQKTEEKVQTSHPPKDRGKSRQHIHQKTGAKAQTNTSTKRQG